MHELSIVESIIGIVRDEVEAKAVSPDQSVLAVHLRAGRLSNILEESVLFYYDCLKEEIPRLKESRLIVHAFAEKARCRQCSREFEIDAPVFFCPHCDGVAELLDTESLWVESIDLTDPQASQ